MILNGMVGLGDGTVVAVEDGLASSMDGMAVLQGQTSVSGNGTTLLEDGMAPLENGTALLQDGAALLQDGMSPLENGAALW